MQELSTYILLPVFIMFAAHCIGDYPLQGEFLATYKAKNNFVLLVHSTIYTAIILMGFWLLNFNNYLSYWSIDQYAHAMYFLLISHFVIDKFKCVIRYEIEKEYGTMEDEEAHKRDVRMFYLDQALHLFVIFLIGVIV